MNPRGDGRADADAQPPARRSCLSVPANSEAKLQKAAGIGADEVVIDLEDSVPTTLKAEALADALAALHSWPSTGPTVSVRVNPPRTPWCHLELGALAAASGPLAAVVIPKVESSGDLAYADRLLDGVESAAGRGQALRLQALIETAPGLLRLDEIAGSSSRLQALILGYADLGASLGRPPSATPRLELWRPAQHAVLVAARAHDLQAIDGPFLGIADDPPFRSAAQASHDLGFDGKWAIHPSQVGPLNVMFTPTADEVRHARAVIEALTSSERELGAGAIKLEGEMIDEAVRRSALRVLSRAGQRITVTATAD